MQTSVPYNMVTTDGVEFNDVIAPCIYATKAKCHRSLNRNNVPIQQVLKVLHCITMEIELYVNTNARGLSHILIGHLCLCYLYV